MRKEYQVFYVNKYFVIWLEKTDFLLIQRMHRRKPRKSSKRKEALFPPESCHTPASTRSHLGHSHIQSVLSHVQDVYTLQNGVVLYTLVSTGLVHCKQQSTCSSSRVRSWDTRGRTSRPHDPASGGHAGPGPSWVQGCPGLVSGGAPLRPLALQHPVAPLNPAPLTTSPAGLGVVLVLALLAGGLHTCLCV